MKLIVLVLFIIAFSPSKGTGKDTIYVAPNGLDTNPGTHVHQNRIHHIYSDTCGGWGPYTDEGATHVTLVDAENYDFRLKSKGIARKIGFKPFDYSKAGVYGSEEWKKLAILDSNRVALFKKLVNEKEK